MLKRLHQILMNCSLEGFSLYIINDDIGRVKLNEGQVCGLSSDALSEITFHMFRCPGVSLIWSRIVKCLL